MVENDIADIVITAAIRIHRELGPGLLESVYEVVLAHELEARGLKIRRQVRIPVRYKGMAFDEGFRADLIVHDLVVIGLKCVESLNNAHRKQLLTYIRLADKRLGFILNFSCAVMKDGIVRVVYRL